MKNQNFPPLHNFLENKVFPKSIEQKLLEFKPYPICSTYMGFEALQIQGLETKEFFIGNYFNGKYCGFIYDGERFTIKQAFKVCEEYMPKHLSELADYDDRFHDKIWYHKLPTDQYAWICNKVLLKV